MVFGRAKSNIVALKSRLCLHSKLAPTDVMVLINEAWSKSFANIITNSKAIAQRGWFPYNRCLLQHSDIHTIITLYKIENEKNKLWYIDLYKDHNNNLPVISKEFLAQKQTIPSLQLNFQYGFTASYLETIIQNKDIYLAREKIRKRQELGCTVKKRLAKY